MRAVGTGLVVALLGGGAAWAEEPAAPPPVQVAQHGDVAGAAGGAAAAEGAPAAATHKKPRKKRKRRRGADADAPRVAGFALAAPWTLRAGGGALVGDGTLRAEAAVAAVGGEVAFAAERGTLRLTVPLAVAHRETFGADLRETEVEGGLAAEVRFSPRLRLGAGVELDGTYRPAWPDQYQPAAGGLGETDRFSHLDRGLTLSAAGIPLRHQHARLAYRYQVVDHVNDPAFDAVDEPTHLVPGDRDEHGVAASWRYLGEGWKLGGTLDLRYATYAYQYARDAGTGRTHAGAGGPPPNPRYRELDVEPALVGELQLMNGRVELDGRFGWEIADDVYQGYYSYGGPHPTVKVAWRPGPAELSARVDLKWRTYGDGSYAAGGGHPMLEWGDRRQDRRFSLVVGGTLPIGQDLHLVARASWIERSTNFPDYVPGVFPDTRAYDIDWDYTNLGVDVAAEWSPR